MSSRFVRSSKYRHVFGRSTRKEQCYDNLRVSRNAWDTNLIKANPEYIAVNWESGGGGAFAVIPVKERGRLPERIPLFRGHTAVVLDTDWNPFNDSLLASASDDGKVFLWRVPDNFSVHQDIPAEEIEDISPVGRLPGHGRKVGHVLFNTAAENVLASAAGDYTVKLWDIEAGSSKLSLKVGEVIQSMSWSANGSLLVTTSRDKKLRIWDTRQEKPAQEVNGHAGAKNSRAVWMGEHDRIATTGFSRMSDRQMALWDVRAPEQPIDGFEMLDSMSGVCMPFWDDGTQCLYLAGKGDGNIRYYEFEHDKFEYLSEYKSADPQRGVAFVPKRGVNMHENEVMRGYKTVNDTYIEPISFIVPRRSESFQDDIYPPTTGLKAAVSSKEWFDGKDGIPPKISLESLYDGSGMKEIPAGEVKKPAKAPEPKRETNPLPTEPQTTTALRGPPPSMKDQHASVRAMVDKYTEKDEPAAEEEEPFEDISRTPTVARSALSKMGATAVGPSIATSTSTSEPVAFHADRTSDARPALAKAAAAAVGVPAPTASSAEPTRAASGGAAPASTQALAQAAAESVGVLEPNAAPADSSVISPLSQEPPPAQQRRMSKEVAFKGDMLEILSDTRSILTEHTAQIAELTRMIASLASEVKMLKEEGGRGSESKEKES